MLAHEPPQSHTYIVDGLIAEASSNILVGDSGIGKTPLLVQMGIAVAMGMPFCGYPTLQGEVLYIDCETGRETFKSILQNIAAHYALPHAPASFVAYSPQWDGREIVPELLLTVHDAIREIRPRLVVVDPLRVLWPRAEIKSEDTVAMIAMQRKLSREYGCAWVNIHHCRKPSNDPAHHMPSLTSNAHDWLLEASGSRALINQTDTRLGVVPGDDLTMAGFERTKGPIQPMSLQRLMHPDSGEPIAYSRLTGLAAVNSSVASLYEALPETFTYDMALKLYAAFHGGKESRSNLGSMLRKMEAAGLVGRYKGKSGFFKTTTPISPTV